MKYRRIAVVLFLCAAWMQTAVARERAHTFHGTVIAFQRAYLCVNGNGNWALLIKLDPRHSDEPEWAIVPFTHPCNSNIDPIPVYSKMQRFRLVRSPFCDETILRDSPANELRLPWTLLASGPAQELPYGQTVPCYHSLDLPLVPAV
jgi:hypothetical protein